MSLTWNTATGSVYDELTATLSFNDDDTNSKTFYNAGTPLGCARHASDGVEPNEYGTWLYGRVSHYH